MLDDLEVKTHLATLADLLARAESTSEEFQGRFGAYSYLWAKDMKEELAAFIAKSYYELPRSEEQVEEEASAGPNYVRLPQPHVPDLAKFEAEVARYLNIREMLNVIKPATDLAWLRVNSNPVKNALGDLVDKWIALYVEHLQGYLVERVNDLAAFVATTNARLKLEVTGTAPPPS
jgi:dynein heavy chain